MCNTVLSTNTATADVESFSKMIYEYGFTIVFCGVILLLISLFFIFYIKKNMKKSDLDQQMLQKERNASLEQHQQMFNLVTKVQTEQVIQLREMTDSLKDMNRSIQHEEDELNAVTESFEKLKESITECDEKSKSIISTLTEILDYVKTSQTCNQEILNKVNLIEKSLIDKK